MHARDEKHDHIFYDEEKSSFELTSVMKDIFKFARSVPAGKEEKVQCGAPPSSPWDQGRASNRRSRHQLSAHVPMLPFQSLPKR